MSDRSTASALIRRHPRRSKHRAAGLVLLFAAVLGVIPGCSSPHGEGATSHAGMVKPLSSEQIQQFQVELFNLLLVRGEPTEILDDGTPSTATRYRRVQQIADDGFEPAAIALGLYDLRRGGLSREDSAAISRLTILAESGDPAAKCLYATYFRGKKQSDNIELNISRYVRESAKVGIPACMTYFSLIASEPENAELHWKTEAARRGDLLAQVRLFWMYFQGIKAPKDLDRAVCWLERAETSNTDFASRNRHALGKQMAGIKPAPAYCAQVTNGK